MSEEIKNTAIELSADELDCVAGGVSILPIDINSQNASLGANSSFEQDVLQVAQETLSGPGGSGSTLLLTAANVKSNASQDFSFGQ